MISPGISQIKPFFPLG